MTDSIDKKSKEKRGDLGVDLDAMLDEAEFSLTPSNEPPDDEDAIDRLLMNAGFDTGDTEMQANSDRNNHVEKDELDDFLSFDGFDGFDDDFNESKIVRPDLPRMATVDIGSVQETTGNLSGEPQDDDDLDRLLMNAGFDIDDTTVQSKADEDLDPLKDPEQTTESATDEVDEFFGFGDDFNESDLIQDDEFKAPAAADLVAAKEEPQAVVEQAINDEEVLDTDFDIDDAAAQANLDEDLSALEEPEQATGTAALVTDEVDESFGFGDDFDESDLIQDNEVKAPAAADSIAPDETLQTAVEQPSDDTNAVDSLVPDAEDALEQTSDKTTEIDDFSGLGDDFDESDLIQDDEVEASALADGESNIDRLMREAGFDVEDTSEKTPEKQDAFGDDTGLDDFFQLDEVSDDFPKQTEDAQLTKADELPAQDDDFLLPDFDITADTEISDDTVLLDKNSNVGIDDELTSTFGDTDFLNEDVATQAFETETAKLQPVDNEIIADPKQAQVNDTAVKDDDNAKLSPFGFEQEDLKKQLEDAENKLKKSKRLGYAALGFGAVAVSAAVGLGVMTYGAKTEVSQLTETVANLEANLAKNTANNPKAEINAMKNSVVQLNQQVDGFIMELKGNSQFPVDLLNNKVPNIVEKQAMVSKALEMLQVKIGGLEGNAASEPSIAEPSKDKVVHEHAPAKEESAHEIAQAKPSAAHEPTPAKEVTTHVQMPSKEGVAHEPASAKEETAHKQAPSKETVAHEPTPTKEAAAHEQAPSKETAAHQPAPTKEDAAHAMVPSKERAIHEAESVKVEATPKTAPVKVKTQTEEIIAKPIVTPKIVAKEEPVKIEKPTATGNWGVNLVAFKQEWFAKSKAAEFARQGVFAEVIPVHEKNTTMYRLRVGGFKTKAEAYSNTARIKKALGLSSVWVSEN
ncbi:MAG: hypothetical protein EPN17_18220 [Methylobacter sp.]|nr:MAG: hypothetical protein EPN17_18220 [Methylobacter sp.]